MKSHRHVNERFTIVIITAQLPKIYETQNVNNQFLRVCENGGTFK